MRSLLPLLLIAAGAAAAQDSIWIDLSGDWKFSPQDNPAFAQPGFDDSAWKTVRLPSDPDLFDQPPAWLRRNVALPPTFQRKDLTITVGTLQDVYQIFVNGIQIGASGDFEDFSRASVPRPRSFRIPDAVAARGAPGPMTVAIRGRQALLVPPTYRIPDKGPYLITTANQTPWHEGEWALDRQWRSLSLYWLQCGMYLLIVITSLMGWWAEKRRTELIWFAVFAFTLAALQYYLISMLHPDAETPMRGAFYDPMIVLMYLTYVTFAQFALVAIRIRAKWPYILIWAGGLITQPVSFLPYIWVSAVTSAVIIGHLWRNWASLATEERVFRLALLVGGLDTALSWLQVLLGVTGTQILIGEYRVARSNIYWGSLALVVLVLLFRRGARERQERERLAGELAAATTIQRLLLSQPALADPGLSLEAHYLPAHEVGGDFYLVIGGEVLLAGDVSGKGLKAAMLVALVTGALRERAERSPAALLGILNRALHGQTEGGFVTCCAIRFEPGGRLSIANAGHVPPYLNGTPIDTSDGLPLGLVADIEYEETTAILAADSQLTLVSDGVIEAANAKGELFGFERTREISTRSAIEIAEAARVWGQNDDITVVTVRRTA